MFSDLVNVQSISFGEHPVADIAHSIPDDFDISAKGLDIPSGFIVNREFVHQYYCQALLSKVCALAQYQLGVFLDYQCGKVSDPSGWLNNLETLFENNIGLLEASTTSYRIIKLFSLIEDRRSLLDAKRSHNKIYKNHLEPSLVAEKKVTSDFLAIKSDLLKMSTFEEKFTYLVERKADYLQNEQFYYRTKNEKTLDELLDIEIEKLERIEESKRRILSSSGVKLDKSFRKIRFYGKTNILADIFFRLKFELPAESGTYIRCEVTEIANMICAVFSDQFGDDLSNGSVRTMLSKGKPEKRPKEEKQVKIQSVK